MALGVSRLDSPGPHPVCLIFGGYGLLGRYLYDEMKNSTAFVPAAVSKSVVDIRDQDAVKKHLDVVKPTLVINCAAVTNVDLCEREPDLAMSINGHAAGAIARACHTRNISMIQVSSDYVFDGTKDGLYLPSDTPRPISVYGESKLLGEQLVLEAGPRTKVARTSWLYGLDGKNIGSRIPEMLLKRQPLACVTDMRSCPTYARYVATCLRLMYGKETRLWQFACEGPATWYDFAKHAAAYLGIENPKLRAISHAELNWPARRPANGAMQSMHAELHITVPPWQYALQEYIEEYLGTPKVA
jgi:dTDP-4-dehydrorhamnose reductase